MKKTGWSVCIGLAVFFASCTTPEKEQDPGIIKQMQCRMEVQPGKQLRAKASNIEGDSASVHFMARWAIRLVSSTKYNGGPNGDSIHLDKSIDIDHTEITRDTAECVFYFHPWSVIAYIIKAPDENGIYQGVPGTETLGWLFQFENPVFVTHYDTVKNRYKDPYFSYLDPDFEPDDNHEVNARIDTVGYIPQSDMVRNKAILLRLFEEKDYKGMVDVLQSGFHIYTCTGAEYRELVRLGLN